MRKIREVLRLKFELDLSERQISKSTQVSRSTINDCLRRFAVSGLPWPLPDELADADIDARLFPPKPALPDALRPEPDWALVNREMRRKGATLFLLWQEYKASQPDGFLCSWFCERYRKWAGKLDVVMRQEHLAGILQDANGVCYFRDRRERVVLMTIPMARSRFSMTGASLNGKKNW